MYTEELCLFLQSDTYLSLPLPSEDQRITAGEESQSTETNTANANPTSSRPAPKIVIKPRPALKIVIKPRASHSAAPAPPASATPSSSAEEAPKTHTSRGHIIRGNDEFSDAITRSAQGVAPLPRLWFAAPDRREWSAAEILLLVFEETRGPFHSGIRQAGFQISEWCRYVSNRSSILTRRIGAS